MALHGICLSAELYATLSTLDCWAVRETDPERLAVMLLGKTAVLLLRSGTMRAIVAERKFGAAAMQLPQEFARLADQCARIRSHSATESSLLATAFFHLRFENIHPLTDGNGRVGRLLLAEQCRRAYNAPLAETLTALHECESDYRAVFAAPNDALKYELMVHLLARILAVRVPDRRELPFALAPVFPERDTRPSAAMRHAPVRAKPPGRSAFF